MVPKLSGVEPWMKKEITYNLRTYGTPFLEETLGGYARRELGEKINEIVARRRKVKLFELSVYPEDDSGERFYVRYRVLRWDNRKGFEPAHDYERKKRRK